MGGRAYLLSMASGLILLTLTGCIAPRSYLDGKYHSASQSPRRSSQARPVSLTVIGQTNGRPNPGATRFWKSQVEKELTSSGCFVIGPSSDQLTITINNLGDMGAAAGRGLATGLTLGAVGTNVTDRYVMTVNYSRTTGSKFSRSYEHAVHSVIGNASAPAGAIGPMSPVEAATRVAEDLVRRFLKDVQ